MSGQEFAGIVEEVGTKVTALKVGDAVLGHKMPFRVRYRKKKIYLRNQHVFFSPFEDCF
jgi:NADPH:quinone reductase-like Zn-dependent oxidoreductase